MVSVNRTGTTPCITLAYLTDRRMQDNTTFCLIFEGMSARATLNATTVALVLLSLLVETVAFVRNLRVRNHPDFARAGSDLPGGRVADALGGE